MNISNSGFVYLFLLLALATLKNVDGQVAATQAVLSVVPVAPMLMTTGIVGLKLMALSRVLKKLGYDQAYLQSGGAGTVAEPIGLQANRYTQNSPTKDQSSTRTSLESKIYPSMALPGEYEDQNRPFRGSNSLREIFQKAGINANIPVQQYQTKSRASTVLKNVARSNRDFGMPALNINPMLRRKRRQI